MAWVYFYAYEQFYASATLDPTTCAEQSQDLQIREEYDLYRQSFPQRQRSNTCITPLLTDSAASSRQVT
jgi:hypothetical protein